MENVGDILGHVEYNGFEASAIKFKVQQQADLAGGSRFGLSTLH